MKETKCLDLFQRIILLTDDESETARFLEIVDKIGMDGVEFIARKVRVRIPLRAMTKDELIWEYLPPALIALACVAVDRLMIHLLQ